MRFVRYEDTGARIGAIRSDDVVDLLTADSPWSTIRAIAAAGEPALLKLGELVDERPADYPLRSSSTGQMIHGLADQIACLSAAFTLETGDLLATGTPEGVGIGRVPKSFLEPGGVVRREIDGIGAIENRVAGGRASGRAGTKGTATWR